MSNRHRGFTLIETIMAIAIIGVGLAGLMSVFSGTVQNSADPVVRKQMLALAEEMIDEIQLKPFAAVAHTAGAACTRQNYNDIWDYEGYATSGHVCDIEGMTIAALDGYSIEVSVDAATLAGVAAAARIDVTVRQGSDFLTLTGWRTNYAP